MNKKNGSLTRIIRCPHCQKNTHYDETNRFRPFCSERCKNDDIVGWAQERYQIPGPPPADDQKDSPQSPSFEDEDLDN